MRGAARSNCHTLVLSHLAAGRGKAASMPPNSGFSHEQPEFVLAHGLCPCRALVLPFFAVVLVSVRLYRVTVTG
jgi:hypothetical protein